MRERTDGDPFRQQRLPAAANQRAQPREELAEIERLHEVVVGAGVEPLDARLDRVARRDHQDRHGAAGIANRRGTPRSRRRLGSMTSRITAS